MPTQGYVARPASRREGGSPRLRDRGTLAACLTTAYSAPSTSGSTRPPAASSGTTGTVRPPSSCTRRAEGPARSGSSRSSTVGTTMTTSSWHRRGARRSTPVWYRNLVAHPDVKIQVRDKVLPVRARTGTPADKRRVWPIMTAQWPAYDEYQAGTKRNIPVVLLSPR